MNGQRVRVLVVDDSAFARKVIREVLSRDPRIEVVGIARDGIEALEKIAELKPDVVTLDLLMPDVDGLGVLRALPKQGRPQVIIVSVSGADTDLAIEALELGAFDLVAKPTPLPTDRLYDLSGELVPKVIAAAQARPIDPLGPELTVSVPVAPVSLATATARVVVVGASTGGPQALTYLFKGLPAGLPVSLAIALHIPAGYTAALAARLSLISGVPICEAADGMEIPPGQGVIAPGGLHLRLRQRGGKVYALVSSEPHDTLHHPSVSLLLQSAAEEFGSTALGVVLTGMGDDGTSGAVAIRTAGGRVLTEAESSCVVYGMPRSVVEAGASNEAAPLRKLPELLIKYIYT